MKEFNYTRYINENQIEQPKQTESDNLDLERVALVLLKNKDDYKAKYGVDTFDTILKVYIGKLKNLGIDFTGETDETIINCFAHYTLFGAQILNPKHV